MRTNILQAKKALLALFAMLMPLWSSVQAFELDGIYYSITSSTDLTVEVTYKGSAFNSYFDEYSGVVTIPSAVTYNGVNYSVTSIGDEAFCYCKKLNTVTIPESVTSIGESAFSSCNGLTSINIPDGVTSIGIKAFYDCSSLKFITIPKSITSIGQSAFFNCNRLAEINIPEGVISIGNSAFQSCSSLKSINIPEGVTCINISVFSDCNSLFDINIPEGVTSIREYAFKGCSSLTAITCEAVIPPTIGSTNTFYNVNKSIPVYVPAGSIAAYQSAEYWNDFERFEAIKTSVSNITLSQSSITLTEGASITLTAIVTPEDADDTSVTWSSSNEDVAMVSSKGKVVALAAGTATITATANDGSGVSASCEVTVTPASYVITFLIDGEQFYAQTLTRGSTITLPEAPTKEGHTFSGWGEVPETMPAHDVTYEGSFTINSYTLTYTVDGKEYNVSTVVYGTALAPLAEPVKEGYTFSGWNEIPATMPADNVVIYGTFAVNKYLVTFKIGDEVIAANTLKYGATIVAPDAPEKEGHTFNGWGDVAETVPASDVTYEGSYSINSYTLTYVVDGEVVLTLPILYGGSIPSLKEPTKEGYTFSGWSEIPETMPAKDVTIEGTFTRLPSVFLTINQADNGYVKQHLTEGTLCTFTIVAAEGWKIHSVTFNGEDVTDQLTKEGTFTTPALSEDAVLNIAYEKSGDNAIEKANANRIKVQGHRGTLRVTGAAEGDDISVYTTDGTLVTQDSAEDSETQLTLPTDQVYIVKVADKVVKIGM